MKRLTFLAALVAATWSLGCAQVDQDEYIRQYGQYNRSDGVFQNKLTNGLELFINGAPHGALGKAVYEDFTDYGDGDDWCIQIDYTECSGTAGEVNYIYLPSGNKLACEAMGTQDILGAVDMDAGSLDISGDQTANDGVECAWGNNGASGGTMTVGTDPAFYSCLQVAIADVSGTDEFHFGIRVANDADADGGFNQTFDDYHDLVAWSIIAAANPADVNISTIAADGGTSEVDTTVNWDDGDRFDLCVFVSATGVATFYYDDSATAANAFKDLKVAPTTATYTFTDAESVIPFVHMLQDTGLTEEVDLYKWAWGYGTFPL